MSNMKVWEVPVNVRASISLKVLASSKEEAIDVANEKLEKDAVFETATGGLDVEYEETRLTLDDTEVEEGAIRETKEDPRQHPDWDPAEGEEEDTTT